MVSILFISHEKFYVHINYMLLFLCIRLWNCTSNLYYHLLFLIDLFFIIIINERQSITLKCQFEFCLKKLSIYFRNQKAKKYDVVFVGAGIVGLATARELILRYPTLSFAILDKEDVLGALLFL